MRLGTLLVLLVLLAGCSDGPPTQPPDPEAEPATVHPYTSMQFVTQADTNSTLGIWVEDGRAYLSGSSGLRILDVSDPTEPRLLASDIPDTQSRDVDLIHHPNGRTYAVLAAGVVKLVDVTDPSNATVVYEGAWCTHNIAVVPGSTVVYSSWSLCQATVPDMLVNGDIEILDFADPYHPSSNLWAFPPVAVTVGGTARPITATSCHDVTFNAELRRAYCAGLSDTMVWDVSDPASPVILQVIDWPGTNIHHAVWDARNGTLLILGDEFAGVAAPSPPCSRTANVPTSALWFFDITDLAAPAPVGYFQVAYDQLPGKQPGVPQYCSTHFGDVVEGADQLVMGWYAAGTVLVDFSDPANARQVAHYRGADPTSTWEARVHEGFVYTGDSARGMDILRLE